MDDELLEEELLEDELELEELLPILEELLPLDELELDELLDDGFAPPQLLSKKSAHINAAARLTLFVARPLSVKEIAGYRRIISRH